MPKEKSAGAIVFIPGAKNRFLLLQYRAGHWDFPKGHLEGDETEETAMLRELGEETGFGQSDSSIVKGFSEGIHYFFSSNRGKIFKEVSFFLVEARHTKVLLSHEHTGFKWLPLEQGIELATHKTAKELLKKAGEFLKEN